MKSISLDAYSRTLAKNCQLFRHTVKAIKSSKQFKHREKITGNLASVSDRIDGGCIDIARDSYEWILRILEPFVPSWDLTTKLSHVLVKIAA